MWATKILKITAVCALVSGFGLLQACEDCSFTSRNSSDLVLGFYFQKPGKDSLVSVSIDSVKTSVGRRVSLASGPVSKLSLPLNPARDSSTFFIFSSPQGRVKREVIKVRYRRSLAVVSPDCGYDQRIDQLMVRTDSTTYKNAVNNPHLQIDTVNVKIFIN